MNIRIKNKILKYCRAYAATNIYITGIGLTTGFIGSHTITVYTLYNSLQFTITLATVSSLVACLPISQDPSACNSATLF
jgi:hypothetical protein